MADPIEDGPFEDVCESCYAHYLDPCDDGCDCDACKKAEQERLRLRELDWADLI